MGLIANTGLSDLKVLIPGPLVATPEWLYPVDTDCSVGGKCLPLGKTITLILACIPSNVGKALYSHMGKRN